ncbi:MAG: DnaJ (Hsp40), sub C, member 17 [Sclerophora amabilis]|nr:MAG: DnaJ (Hsp40), sub C, member 17 [Sclerophora amabilis]
MPSSDDLSTHATSSHDFYALLELDGSTSQTLTAHAIRRAHKRAALKHHPDKNASDPVAAAAKFHLIQIAYEVLSDERVRAAYDGAREARVSRQRQRQAYDGRRREMMDDLERREKAGGGGGGVFGKGLKRGRGEADEEDEDPEERLAREVRRLAQDGKRRRTEREEMLRRENEGRDGDATVDGKSNGSRTKAAPAPPASANTNTDAPAGPKGPTPSAQKNGASGRAFEESTLARLRAAAAKRKQMQNVAAEGQSSPAVN